MFTLAVAAGLAALAALAAVAAGLAALSALAAVAAGLAAVAAGLAALAAGLAALAAALAALAAALAALAAGRAALAAGLAALPPCAPPPPLRANPHSPGQTPRGVPPCGDAPLLNLAARQRPVRKHEDTGWPRADNNADPHPGFRRVVGGFNTPTRASPAGTTTTSWRYPARPTRC